MRVSLPLAGARTGLDHNGRRAPESALRGEVGSSSVTGRWELGQVQLKLA